MSVPLLYKFVEACQSGSLAIAQDLWSSNWRQVAMGWTKALEKSVRSGKVDCVEWLWELRGSEGPPMDLKTRLIDSVVQENKEMFRYLGRKGCHPSPLKCQEVFEQSVAQRDRTWISLLLDNSSDWVPKIGDSIIPKPPIVESLAGNPEDIPYLRWLWEKLGQPPVGNRIFTYALSKKNFTTARWAEQIMDVSPSRPRFHGDKDWEALVDSHFVHPSIKDEYQSLSNNK
jgi:hypothetical protein